ncbi:hypothetical protein YC2023_051161 [Brassica napus]
MLKMLRCPQKPQHSYLKDEWSDEEVDSMIQIGGNASANSIYEAFIPDGFSKPGPDATHDLRFIREVLL